MGKHILRRHRALTAFLGILGILLSEIFFAVPAQIQAEAQEIALEKSAFWESEEDYRAAIHLKASGIEKYTQKEIPLSVIPLLDVTASMDHCETPGHYHKIFYHWLGAFEGASDLWKHTIVPMLPTPEEYGQMGRENPDQMFLRFPEEIDPYGRCRLVYQKGRSEQRDYYSMFNWMVFYVDENEDGTPLYPLREGDVMKYDFGHTVFGDGVYLPVGTAEEAGDYTAWAYTNYKEPGHDCQVSRLDQLKDGYAQFIQSLFENPGVRVCPVAFVGGYSINGWTEDPQEAIDFLVQESYLEKEQVMPDYNCGTNYEAALAGAMDAANRLEKRENTFAILFTDGSASSGYDHTSGEVDLGRLDVHSYEMPEQDESWYPVFAEWAIQDAQALKETVPVYSVGYGSALEQESTLETLQKISSGGEYFIDTRLTSIQTVADIFRIIYSDMLYKATRVHIIDYISEFWEIDPEKLPEGCSVEQIAIVNQKGQPDTISKLTYPITREMGADDREELQIPVILREAYREVEQKTLYETNQDAPLDKDQEGTGAFMEYVDLKGQSQRIYAETPRLEVSPEQTEQTDFRLEKKALDAQIKAGETARYEFRLENCGSVDLTEIRLEDVFSKKEILFTFDQTEGAVQEETGILRIQSLKKGEEKILTGTAKIPEDFQGELENIVTATAKNPQNPEEEIRREAKARITVLPLKLDFQIKKTADREKASPGETLIYQIRVSNTGERRLDAVTVTDKFEKADIQAVFQKQEGVAIEEDGAQAVIESILPGKEVVLTALAKIPANAAAGELLNTASASPKGEHAQEKSAQASVRIEKKVSENSISSNAKPSASENTVSGNRPQISENIISENTISENTVSENIVSGNLGQQVSQQKYASVTETPKADSGQKGTNTASTTPRASTSGTGASSTTTGAGTDGKGISSAMSPKTADDSPIFLLAALTGLSAVVTIVSAACRFYRRKR